MQQRRVGPFSTVCTVGASVPPVPSVGTVCLRPKACGASTHRQTIPCTRQPCPGSTWRGALHPIPIVCDTAVLLTCDTSFQFLSVPCSTFQSRRYLVCHHGGLLFSLQSSSHSSGKGQWALGWRWRRCCPFESCDWMNDAVLFQASRMHASA